MLAGLVSLAGLAELVTLAFYRSTTAYGLPTRATWDAMWADLDLAWTSFPTAITPVPAVTGYVVAAVHRRLGRRVPRRRFAFRALAAIEAILPSGILFVFAAALGADNYRWLSTALWLGAALLAFALHRTMAQDGGGWLAGIRRGTIGSVTRTAAIIGVAVVALALVVGPALPGAGEKAILDTTPVGSGTRQTVSPLVDIQGRIVDRSDLEAFTVAGRRQELLATHGARRVRRPPVDLRAGLRRGRRRARRRPPPGADRAAQPGVHHRGPRRHLAAGGLRARSASTSPTASATTTRPPAW